MAQLQGCTHNFDYLLKVYSDGSYIGRVLQLPAVMAEGNSEHEIDTEIQKATLDYLKFFEEEHKKARDNLLKPKLITPSSGVIVKTKPFTVKC